MPVVPIRDLGKIGVITDVDPFDLPMGAFTLGVNARFENNKITRGPVFRQVGDITNTDPRFVISFKQLAGGAEYLIAQKNGRVHKFSVSGLGGTVTETDQSISGYITNDSDEPFTGLQVNDVVYLNRSDRVPWYRLKTGTQFAPLTNWDTGWRCGSLRSLNGILVAINMVEASTAYPSRVRWSDFTTFQNVPLTWTPGATNSAGDNVLADMGEALVDGQNFRDRLVLYGKTEAWMMEFTGSSDVFAFRRVFQNRGVINVNCVTEVNGLHYVFGSDDIWVHDGVTDSSIADGKVRSFIFDNLDQTKAKQCFVYHNPRLNEIMFCYVSGDRKLAYSPAAWGCNRAAVYNYAAKTWYFYDLPYVVSGGFGVPATGASYADIGSVTYTSVGGSYSTYSDSERIVPMLTTCAGTGIAAGVKSFDLVNSTNANGALLTAANGPMYLENLTMDLDTLGAELRGYKLLKSIYPEIRTEIGGGSLDITTTSNDLPAVSPSNALVQTFDPTLDYKCDFNQAGRYISLTMAYSGLKTVSISGLDLDLMLLGKR